MRIDGEFFGGQSLVSSDFVGAAKLFLTAEDYAAFTKLAASGVVDDVVSGAVLADRVDIDLAITQVGFSLADFNRVEAHIGDTFGTTFLGRRPIALTLAGKLLCSHGSPAKYILTKLYAEFFRLHQVARRKIVPNIEFVRCIAQGAFSNMSLSESSQEEGVVNVQAQFMVFNLYLFNPANLGVYRERSMLFNKESAYDVSGLYPSTSE